MTKGVLRNFTKFTGKYLCHSLFFNKVAGLRPATLLKKRLWHSCFPVNFAKFLRTPILQNSPGRLLLCIKIWVLLMNVKRVVCSVFNECDLLSYDNSSSSNHGKSWSKRRKTFKMYFYELVEDYWNFAFWTLVRGVFLHCASSLQIS